MTNVKLVAETNRPPEQLASNAGRTCYESEIPALEKEKINVRERLFETGHHTTLEHSYFTFAVDDVSVSTHTYGLHLTHPFYNSDQRSGRYSKMYDNPDMNDVKNRLEHYFPDEKNERALDLVKYGVDVFQSNKESLTDIAKDVLKKERPNASEKYIQQNAKKMAQEQLRVFISTVAPTGMYHTIDLITLAALNRVAWTPEMKDVVEEMQNSVRYNHPEISYVFDLPYSAAKPKNVHFCDLATKEVEGLFGSEEVSAADVKFAPKLSIKNIDIPQDYDPFANTDVDAVDTLMFDPMAMDNNVYSIRTEVEISTVTMGQDQRHRTIVRGMPHITGNFYLPPLLKIAGLAPQAKELQLKWESLIQSQPLVANFVIPYGAMVRYQKRSGLNALLHEQEKRLCWCAQEEIYNLNAQLAKGLLTDYPKLVKAMSPHCKKGKCLEGMRYCSRDLTAADYFRGRQI